VSNLFFASPELRAQKSAAIAGAIAAQWGEGLLKSRHDHAALR
jgi:hypothetical protein